MYFLVTFNVVLFSQISLRPVGPNQSLIQWVSEGFARGIYYRLLSTVKVKNAWSHASTPHVFFVWPVIKNRHNFISPLIDYTCSNNITTVIYTWHIIVLYINIHRRDKDYIKMLLPHRKLRWAALFILLTVIYIINHIVTWREMLSWLCGTWIRNKHTRTPPRRRYCMQFCLGELRTRTNVWVIIGIVWVIIGIVWVIIGIV
jgi:hypothetical protein